jgi:hypothetical protein
VVYLVPGVGMITFAKDKATARISGEFYVNAINVMRGASAVAPIRGFRRRKPSTSNTGCLKRQSCSACQSPRRSPGVIALVTGGAGGIGSATAERCSGGRRLRRDCRH